VVVLLVTGLLIGRTVRALPPQARPVVAAALRTDRPLRFTYVAVATCVGIFVLVAVTGFAPLAAAVWMVLVGLGLLALLVGLIRRMRRPRG
jgi:hypothetical protein